MKWFKKKEKAWWAEGHTPIGSQMGKVEKALHDSWLDYLYDKEHDCLYIAIQRMEAGASPLFAMINGDEDGDITITSFTSWPLVCQKDSVPITAKLTAVNESSNSINLQIAPDGKTIISRIILKPTIQDVEKRVFPTLLEQARIVDERYEDVKTGYTEYAETPLQTNECTLVFGALLTLNKVANINGELAIIHQSE